MYQPSHETVALLEELERLLEPAVEEDFQAQWRDFLYDRFDGEVFTPCRKHLSHTALALPHININDAIADYDLMMRAQLTAALQALGSTNHTPCVRANYGTGILSSLFGAEIFIMPYENDTLPTTRAFNDTERMRETVARGIPDLSAGFGRQVFEMGEIYRETFASYPSVAKYVEVYHPDLQGPLDVAELLWGGEMFYTMYDEPELVHDALTLITDTYTAFMKRWHELFPPRKDMNPHWASLWHRGAILIRNDSAMNLSPEFYTEFSVPYDKALLERFGGGAIHFCGRGDHYIEALSALPDIYAVNLSQPQYNDMEKIYRSTVDKGIKLLALNKERAHADLGREGSLRHCVHA